MPISIYTVSHLKAETLSLQCLPCVYSQCPEHRCYVINVPGREGGKDGSWEEEVKEKA